MPKSRAYPAPSTKSANHRALCLSLLASCLFSLSGCSTLTPPEDRPDRDIPLVAEEVIPADVVEPPVQDNKASSLMVAAVGDIMLGTNYPDDRLPPNGGRELLAGAKPYLQQADIAFANLEGGVFDGGEPLKRCSRPSLCYLFRTPAGFIQRFSEAGFDVVSLANNHARDFGEDGRTATMLALDSVGIRHSGRDGDIASWVVNGISVAVIAYAPYGGSNDMLDLGRATQQIADLATVHDIVIVSLHAGAEGAGALHVPFEVEIYHGEVRGDVALFAHAVIDAGADLVLGHGPHVPRALEIYKERLIAYSLGNFATYQGVNIRGNNGLAPILMTELAATGQFLGGRVVSAQQHRPDGTLIDANHSAAKLMARLSREDFPASALTIGDDGTLFIAPAGDEGH